MLDVDAFTLRPGRGACQIEESRDLNKTTFLTSKSFLMDSPNLPSKKTRSPRELARAMHGVFNFMVTPFYASLKLNAKGLQENIHYHAAAGAQDMTILVGGGMGEVLSLDVEEHRLVAEAAVAGAEGKMPVVVGVRGGYQLGMRMARNAEQSGADAMFLLGPPFGSETAEGAYQYMK